MRLYIAILSCFLIASKVQSKLPSFPDDFLFGVASSAYQIEGAWNEDGKGWSMWDHMVRTKPDSIVDKNNGDISCDSYHLFKRDIEMLKELGVKAYRFSISWPRVLPYGRPDYVNPLAISYYNNVIDELLVNDIVPFVTIYHWDLPQNLNERGGWLSEDIVDWFGDYARVLFQNFGDRVKYWMTINEPHIHCKLGYSLGIHAPGTKSPGTGFYECGRHILLANARAYHIYSDEFRYSQKGQIGMVLDVNWAEPATDSQDDADAVLSYLALTLRQYADPIFSEHGNYPQLLIDRVAAASAEQGYNSSRLRPLTEEQIKYIKGSADFLGLNTYNTDFVYRNASVDGLYEIPSMSHDAYYGTIDGQFVPLNGSHDIYEYAPGFYKLLTYIEDNYNNPPVYITENGYSLVSDLNDNNRAAYIRNYLTALLAAREDGANVKGYMVWSLMDSFEWATGYTIKMGLYQVDMTDPKRTRTPRKSAFVYKDIIKNKYINYSFDPDAYTNGSRAMHIKSCITLLASLVILFDYTSKPTQSFPLN